jgi:hypothetical protein
LSTRGDIADRLRVEAGMSKKIVLAGAIILGATNAALAVDCRTSPDQSVRGKWSVETVDGKICWFLGNSATPKEELRWPGRDKAESKKAASSTAPKQAESKKPEQAKPDKSAGAAKREQAESKKSAASPKREQVEPKKSADSSRRDQAEPKKTADSSKREQAEPRKLASLAKSGPAQPEKLASSPSGQKVECQAQVDKSKSGRWSWRTIDNRQCWFVGGHDTPRESLFWPVQKAAPTQDDAKNDPRPPEGKPASPDSSQLVNQESGGDLEFIVPGAWFASPLSIDLQVGAQFLTHVSITLWPLVGDTPTQYLRTADFAFGR